MLCNNLNGKSIRKGIHAYVSLSHWAVYLKLTNTVKLCTVLSRSVMCQSCPTLCNPMDCSPLGSSVRGDSPGKNTGVGCHVLLQGVFPTQQLNPGFCIENSGSLWWTGRPGVLQFMVSQRVGHDWATELNWTELLHCRWILYHLNHQGSPRILEWVAYPFSRGLPNPGIESVSPVLQADSLPGELQGKC